MKKLKKLIDEFSSKYPQWDEIVAEFLDSDDEEPKPQDQEIMDEFSEILEKIVDVAKAEDLTTEDMSAAFEDLACREFIQKYISLKMESYFNYAPLRKLSAEDSFKAQFCIDLIWSSYIVRFNSHMIFDEKVPMNEEDYKTVSVQLDRFVDRCISRQLHRTAVIIDLKEESHLSQEICEYIVDKFEKDYNQIRLNYIIYRLSSCEKSIRDLAEKITE